MEKTFRTGRFIVALSLLALLVVAAGALPGTALAQDRDAYHWERLDVRLDIKEGGRLEVAETHTYRFEKELTGDLYRSISLANLDRVSNVGLTRDGKSVDNETGTTGTAPHGAYYVRWEPGRIEIPETRTYVLKYSVAGAFTDVGGEHLFHWTALFPDRGAEVKAGSVTVTVPEGNERLLDGLSVYGPGVKSERDGNELKLTLLEALPASGALAVGMTLPPGTLGISKPNWQTAAERDAERAERNRILDAQKRERNAKIKKAVAWGFRIAGLAGVLLTALVAWRTLNSPVGHERRHEGRVESPPSDLSPGMVSVLWNR